MNKILIADDIPEILLAYEIVLQQAGYHTCSAHTGNEAIRLLKQDQDIDLVLTDLMMPDGDGFQVATSARKMPKPPKLIVVTGGSDRISSEQALQMSNGFFDVRLTKPLEAKELLAAIDEVLRKRN